MSFEVPIPDIELVAHSIPNMPHPITVTHTPKWGVVEVRFGGVDGWYAEYDDEIFRHERGIWEPVVRDELERLRRKVNA